MARQLRTNHEIDAYLRLVRRAANHHGHNVEHIIDYIAAEVRRRVNLNSDLIEAYERLGKIGRTCWVTIAGNRYAFSYVHANGQIELREDGIQGRVLACFDNSVSLKIVKSHVNAM